MSTILSRYLDPETLGRVANRTLDPKALVLGNLAGAHKSPLAGFAVEFASHREYVAGDDPRHIDWRLYYKRDRYFIKQYEMETNFVCHLVLDMSASMRFGEGSEQKLAYAASLVATLGYAIVRHNDKVSLATFDENLQTHIPPANGMAQILKVVRHLDEIQPLEKTSMAESLSQLNGRFGRREIVMIFSDFLTDLDALESVLQRMRYNHHEVVLFHVMHHSELTFEFEGMVKFKGLEVVEEHLTQTEDIRAAYLTAVDEFMLKFDDVCTRNRIERVLVDTSKNPGDVLIEYLNRRSLMTGRR